LLAFCLVHYGPPTTIHAHATCEKHVDVNARTHTVIITNETTMHRITKINVGGPSTHQTTQQFTRMRTQTFQLPISSCVKIVNNYCPR